MADPTDRASALHTKGILGICALSLPAVTGLVLGKGDKTPKIFSMQTMSTGTFTSLFSSEPDEKKKRKRR